MKGAAEGSWGRMAGKALAARPGCAELCTEEAACFSVSSMSCVGAFWLGITGRLQS